MTPIVCKMLPFEEKRAATSTGRVLPRKALSSDTQLQLRGEEFYERDYFRTQSAQ